MSESSLTCEALVRQAALDIGGESPRLDAELLMEHATGWNRTSQRAWPERTLDKTQQARFEIRVAERKAGRPIAHILGSQWFWSLPLQVNDSTLIPRPDTECLVEAALALALPSEARILDLGTGTGAIALALVSERPGWQVVACDAAVGAVALAQANARQLQLAVDVIRSHWFDQLPAQQFDLIVSNPPYIACGDHHLAEGDVRFEPRGALVAGEDGLDDLRLIIAQAPGWLADKGWLLVEHGYDQGLPVRGLFSAAGFEDVITGQDYGGNDRYTLGCLAR